MKNRIESDTKKSIDRLSTLSTEASSHTFKLIDITAKKASDYFENKTFEYQDVNNDDGTNKELKTSENDNLLEKNQENSPQSDKDSLDRMKTIVNKDNNNDIQPAGKNDNILDTDVDNESKVSEKSKLKTAVEKTGQKLFKFNENQGNVSKLATVVGKSGEKVSKVGKTIIRTSRELNKAMSEDGSGIDYLNEKINRKIKTKVSKNARKTASKIGKKLYQTLGKKLLHLFKNVILKLLKVLISVISALSEFIIPIALIVLLLVAVLCVFGAGASDATIDSYEEYMDSIQKEYDEKVDKFLKENPTGIVIGVNGSYGKIDWRIPLSILQGTGADLVFDEDEKELLQQFNDAGLFEKHEISEQIVTSGDSSGNALESSIKVLIITNCVYEDYIEWLKQNYSYISNFNKKKNVSDGNDTYFSNEQLETIELLYQSDYFTDVLGDDFKTRTPSYGSNDKSADLDSSFYNSKNILTSIGLKGQCTWYSYGRALELFNVVLPAGNAQTWLNTAITMGYETGTQPSYNSVVVLASKNFGHVAFVEAYDGKTITISEGNIGNPCSNNDFCSQVDYAREHANELVRTKTYSSFDEYRRINKVNGYTVIGFIYLE